MNHWSHAVSTRLALSIALAALLGACASSAERAEGEASAGLEKARSGALPEAIGHFERALELDDENPKARYNLALAHLVSRRGAEAAVHLRRFLETRPDDAAAHFELGRALALAGSPDLAIAELQRAATLGFSDFSALEGGGFESLEEDLRFVQVRALLAQRAGVVLHPEQFRPGNGTGYGGVAVPVPLPGLAPVGACGRETSRSDSAAPHGVPATCE